ncbi:hypothetical protein RQP46_006744 [Phenoliferia psychrophenolica]
MIALPYSQLRPASAEELTTKMGTLCGSPASKAEALDMMLPFYKTWEAKWWPAAGATAEFHASNWLMVMSMDAFRFYIMRLLFQAQPGRIVEASSLAQRRLEHLLICIQLSNMQNGTSLSLAAEDPAAYRFAGAGLFYDGGDIKTAEKYLRISLRRPPAEGDGGAVWARAVLVRVLAVQGHTEEAQKVSQVRLVDSSPEICPELEDRTDRFLTVCRPNCISLTAVRQKAEENALVPGKRGQVELSEKLERWFSVVTPLFNSVLPSAFRYSLTTPLAALIHTHYLSVCIIFTPSAQDPRNIFSIATAVLEPHAALQAYEKGAIARGLRELLANSTSASVGLVDFPVFVAVFEKGKRVPTMVDLTSFSIPEVKLRSMEHDPDWEKALKGR